MPGTLTDPKAIDPTKPLTLSVSDFLFSSKCTEFKNIILKGPGRLDDVSVNTIGGQQFGFETLDISKIEVRPEFIAWLYEQYKKISSGSITISEKQLHDFYAWHKQYKHNEALPQLNIFTVDDAAISEHDLKKYMRQNLDALKNATITSVETLSAQKLSIPAFRSLALECGARVQLEKRERKKPGYKVANCQLTWDEYRTLKAMDVREFANVSIAQPTRASARDEEAKKVTPKSAPVVQEAALDASNIKEKPLDDLISNINRVDTTKAGVPELVHLVAGRKELTSAALKSSLLETDTKITNVIVSEQLDLSSVGKDVVSIDKQIKLIEKINRVTWDQKQFADRRQEPAQVQLEHGIILPNFILNQHENKKHIQDRLQKNNPVGVSHILAHAKNRLEQMRKPPRKNIKYQVASQFDPKSLSSTILRNDVFEEKAKAHGLRDCRGLTIHGYIDLSMQPDAKKKRRTIKHLDLINANPDTVINLCDAILDKGKLNVATCKGIIINDGTDFRNCDPRADWSPEMQLIFVGKKGEKAKQTTVENLYKKLTERSEFNFSKDNEKDFIYRLNELDPKHKKTSIGQKLFDVLCHMHEHQHAWYKIGRRATSRAHEAFAIAKNDKNIFTELNDLEEYCNPKKTPTSTPPRSEHEIAVTADESQKRSIGLPPAATDDAYTLRSETQSRSAPTTHFAQSDGDDFMVRQLLHENSELRRELEARAAQEQKEKAEEASKKCITEAEELLTRALCSSKNDSYHSAILFGSDDDSDAAKAARRQLEDRVISAYLLLKNTNSETTLKYREALEKNILPNFLADKVHDRKQMRDGAQVCWRRSNIILRLAQAAEIPDAKSLRKANDMSGGASYSPLMFQRLPADEEKKLCQQMWASTPLSKLATAQKPSCIDPTILSRVSKKMVSYYGDRTRTEKDNIYLERQFYIAELINNKKLDEAKCEVAAMKVAWPSKPLCICSVGFGDVSLADLAQVGIDADPTALSAATIKSQKPTPQSTEQIPARGRAESRSLGRARRSHTLQPRTQTPLKTDVSSQLVSQRESYIASLVVNAKSDAANTAYVAFLNHKDEYHMTLNHALIAEFDILLKDLNTKDDQRFAKLHALNTSLAVNGAMNLYQKHISEEQRNILKNREKNILSGAWEFTRALSPIIDCLRCGRSIQPELLSALQACVDRKNKINWAYENSSLSDVLETLKKITNENRKPLAAAVYNLLPPPTPADDTTEHSLDDFTQEKLDKIYQAAYRIDLVPSLLDKYFLPAWKKLCGTHAINHTDVLQNEIIAKILPPGSVPTDGLKVYPDVCLAKGVSKDVRINETDSINVNYYKYLRAIQIQKAFSRLRSCKQPDKIGDYFYELERLLYMSSVEIAKIDNRDFVRYLSETQKAVKAAGEEWHGRVSAVLSIPSRKNIKEEEQSQNRAETLAGLIKKYDSFASQATFSTSVSALADISNRTKKDKVISAIKEIIKGARQYIDDYTYNGKTLMGGTLSCDKEGNLGDYSARLEYLKPILGENTFKYLCIQQVEELLNNIIKKINATSENLDAIIKMAFLDIKTALTVAQDEIEFELNKGRWKRHKNYSRAIESAVTGFNTHGQKLNEKFQLQLPIAEQFSDRHSSHSGDDVPQNTQDLATLDTTPPVSLRETPTTSPEPTPDDDQMISAMFEAAKQAQAADSTMSASAVSQETIKERIKNGVIIKYVLNKIVDTLLAESQRPINPELLFQLFQCFKEVQENGDTKLVAKEFILVGDKIDEKRIFDLQCSLVKSDSVKSNQLFALSEVVQSLQHPTKPALRMSYVRGLLGALYRVNEIEMVLGGVFSSASVTPKPVFDNLKEKLKFLSGELEDYHTVLSVFDEAIEALRSCTIIQVATPQQARPASVPTNRTFSTTTAMLSRYVGATNIEAMRRSSIPPSSAPIRPIDAAIQKITAAKEKWMRDVSLTLDVTKVPASQTAAAALSLKPL